MDIDSLPRFSDFAETRALEGQKQRIGDVLNKEIVVLGYQVKSSKVKDCDKYLTIQFAFMDNTDEPHVLFTASDVLRQQLQSYEDNMPFLAVIKKVNSYYTFG